MGENTHNFNFSVTIHQARIDLNICSLILSPQVFLSYNEIAVRTKVLHNLLPI